MANLVSGRAEIVAFVGAMLAGMFLFKLLERRTPTNLRSSREMPRPAR